MGEINFLTDNRTSKNDDKSDKPETGKSFFSSRWTDPKKIRGSKDVSGPEMPFTSAVKVRSSSTKTAAASSAKAEGANTTAMEYDVSDRGGEASVRGGLIGRLFGFLKKGSRDLEPNDSLVERKKLIYGNNEAANNEKKARKSGDMAAADISAYGAASVKSGSISQTGPVDKTVNENANKILDSAGNSKPSSGDNYRSGLTGIKTRTIENKWYAPKILKTDLIKDEITIFIDWQKNIRDLTINLLLAAIIIGVVYAGLVLWGSSSAQQTKALDQEIRVLSENIIANQKEMAPIENFRKNLEIIAKMLDRHVYWTNFFQFLESDTLTDVYYTGGFKGDLSGQFKFSAVAGSFDDLTNQIRVFKADSENIVSAETGGGELNADKNKSKTDPGAAGEETVSFSLDLVVNPEIFYKN